MYFLAGVANADLYSGDVLVAQSRTLINSSITVGLTAEDIRAGQGAKLYGKYFHSSTFDLTLEDQMWNLDYIAHNVGSAIQVGGDVTTFESVTLGEGGVGTLSKEPVSFGTYGTIGWAALVGTENFQKVDFTGNTFTIPGGVAGQVYCVKYFTNNDAARKLVINANFIPDTLRCVLTATLFAGDASNPTAGTKAGTIQINVPRLVLSGAQELSMEMTGNSTTSLSGSALAVNDSASCDGEGYYAELLEIVEGAKWYDNCIGLMVVDADFTMATTDTKTLVVKAIYGNGQQPKTVNNADLTFTSTVEGIATVGANTGIITPVAEGETTIVINVTEEPTIEGVAYCTVSNS